MTPYFKNNLRPQRTRPSGFTLIELMVVIGILALLASLSLMAYRGFVGNAREKATQATIVKIDGILLDRMEAFNRWIDSQHVEAPGRPDYVYNTDYAPLAAAGISPGNVDFRDLAMIFARKNRFREFFPQMFSEIPSGVPTSATTANENAECLYHFIMNAQSFSTAPIEEGFFKTAEIGDTDGDSMMEFLDSWGNPIRFYRWPTRLVPAVWQPSTGYARGQWVRSAVDNRRYYRCVAPAAGGNSSSTEPTWPTSATSEVTDGAVTWECHNMTDLLMGDPPGGTSLTEDPDDPNGFVIDFLIMMENNSTPYDFEYNFHSPATYHTPLIVSAGQDGSGPGGGGLGLYEPTDDPKHPSAPVTAFGYLAQPDPTQFVPGTDQRVDPLADNITNLNSRVGGR